MTMLWMFVGVALFLGFVGSAGLILWVRYLFSRRYYDLEYTVMVSVYRLIAVCLLLSVLVLIVNTIWSIGAVTGVW